MGRVYDTSGLNQLHHVMSGIGSGSLSTILGGSGVTSAGTEITIGLGVYVIGSINVARTNEGGTGSSFLLLEAKS
jgi:hypothetical protein